MCGSAVPDIVGRDLSIRCLVVDDNASFREEMQALLEQQGIDVVGGAASAAEGLQQISELRPDVAFIDIDLGGDSGLALARQLSENAGHLPKVILISTHDETEFADLIEESPAVGFLAKTDLSATAIRLILAAVDEAGTGRDQSS